MKRTAIAAILAAGSMLGMAHAASLSTNGNNASPLPSGSQPNGTPCGTVVLTQNPNNTPTPGSVSCNNGAANGFEHADNSYFRAFNLGAFPSGFNACAVEFGVETANAGDPATTQPITVNIYSNTGGAFPAGTRTVVGTATVQVPDQTLGLVSVPITANVPAGAELVAEVFTPNGQAANHSFFIGSNATAETGPSYIQAADCGLASPAALSSIGFPNMHLILNVRGGAPAADLAITKTDGVTTVTAGGTTTYTITATNPAAGTAATPVTIADTFPAGLTCTYTSVAAGGATGNTASGSGNINDTTVTMPAGSSVTYTATCAISAAATGTIANTATIAGPAGLDPNAANNSATDTDTVAAGANVSGTKTASSGTVIPGQAFSYTIVLNNTGNGAQGDNAGAEFTDVLPAGVTGTSVTATSGIATLVGNTVAWNGAIAAGGSVTITINATLAAGTFGATINNQGTISYDSNGDGTNDATRATDNPALPGAADATGVVVGGAPAQSVPVDARWALLLLALGLGFIALRRMNATR